ncbi:MAG TPA: DUF4230 domain-containing protein [Gemmatimonadales bacterium]|nr:DUF4230 domain-containing protein [Gemmatimonadales bacterium]
MSRGRWIAMIVAVAIVSWMAGSRCASGRSLAPGGKRGGLTHSLVVERLRSVAQLVTSETTVRDVVTYQDTRLGSTKRSLVVATARVTAGIDLDPPPEIRIDSTRRHVEVILPPARVLGIEVVELETYDEQRGLWNPFRPADRDAIFREARSQLGRSAEELGLAAHAQSSARALLGALIRAEGYSATISFAPGVAAPAD